tara:strand:+ start:383 stop:562 length:180 start_codon:yes stop_codon:yes gene_type:complete
VQVNVDFEKIPKNTSVHGLPQSIFSILEKRVIKHQVISCGNGLHALLLIDGKGEDPENN